MGVIGLVARLATTRVHVFLVETPGWSFLRMTAQAAIARRGWVEATGPADADALLVCGSPDERLLELIDAVWEQIPSPRCRALAHTGQSVSGVLDSIAVALRDNVRQQADARTRRLRLDDTLGADPAAASSGHTDMCDDDDSMHMGSNSEMDMDMSGPAGIALAGGDDDRDGLEMDVTHLTLGPLLAGWPADLVLHGTLHGDVVADARAERLPGSGPADQPPEAARLLDDAACLLMVAGWEPAAQELASLRNGFLQGTGPDRLLARLHRVSARVRRSRTLRWTLKGITAVGAPSVRDHLLVWLDTAREILSSSDAMATRGRVDSVAGVMLEEIRLAVLGQEIAATRLIVAALGSQPIRTISAVAND